MSTEASETIQAGSTVEMYFSLALPNGEIIDSNFEKKPASFRLGDGNILPGFEKPLVGLRPGDSVEQTISAKEAFGDPNPANQQRFPIAKFQHLLEDDLVPTELGAVVTFKDPGGFDIPGVVTAIDESSVEIDFNHPLAGKDIVFRAQIVSVLAPDQQAVEIKL